MEPLLDIIRKRIFIIAEIGCNHNGDMAIARELVNAAAESGADAAKFQSFDPKSLLLKDAPKAQYQLIATGAKESQYERLERLQLSRRQHQALKRHCENLNIIFCSSPFDHQSALLLNDLDVQFFKIGSGEITNLPLLAYIGSFNKPIILSTGMSDLGEIETALDAIGKQNRENIILMHCISDYPAKWEEANLRAIPTLKSAFKLPVGFSDHSRGIELALVSIGLGAVIIEKHITLSRKMDGGDHKASLVPDEFKELIDKIRKIEMALGDGIKRCMSSEENVRDVARKSIMTIRKINKGQTLQEKDIAIKRPGTGIQPIYMSQIIGATAIKDISSNCQLQWSQIELKP